MVLRQPQFRSTFTNGPARCRERTGEVDLERMSLLAPLGALALLAIPVIVGLYLLKRRRPEVRSAALRLWRGDAVMEQANRPWQRLRKNRLLLLQLLVALLLGLALTRPAFSSNVGQSPATVI